MRVAVRIPRPVRAIWPWTLILVLAWTARVDAGPDGSWYQLGAVGQEQAAVFDPLERRMLLFGGIHEGGISNELWECALAGAPEWTRIEVADPRPAARHGQSMIYDARRNRLVLFGGGDAAGAVLNDVWALQLGVASPAWVQWSPLGTAPAARGYHSAVYDSLQDRMIVFGGAQQLGVDGPPSDFLGDLWTLSLGDTPAWDEVIQVGPQPGILCGHVAFCEQARNRMVLFGGFDGVMTNETWALSLTPTLGWSQIIPAGTLPLARAAAAAAIDPLGDRLIIFGGVDDSFNAMNDLWQLSLASPEWAPLSPSGGTPTERMFASAVSDPANNRFILYGQSDQRGTGVIPDPFWELSLGATPAWTQLMPWTGPEARVSHMAIYDAPRNRMIVVGGHAYPINYGDVWSLSLGTTPQWVEITPAGMPLVLIGGAAIRDSLRNNMVIFGGWGSNLVHTMTLGGVPVWDTMSPAGTWPEGRDRPTGVYDAEGDRMIVFGGAAGSSGTFNDTWVLDLAGTMSWTQLQPHGTLPPARWGHAAAWDPIGRRMIIYGGSAESENDSLPIGDVWQLSMGDTTWTELAPLGTPPAPRLHPTAIYDPGYRRILFFGGNLAPPAWETNETWELSLGAEPAWHRLDFGTDSQGPKRSWHTSVFDPVRGRMITFGGWLTAMTWILKVPVPAPPAIAASLLDATAAAGQVQVRWELAERDAPVTVYRREETSPWTAAGSLQADSRGILAFVDRDVTAGRRYGYCVGIQTEAGEIRAGEVWVDVTSEMRFALHGCRPNPVRRVPVVAFSLTGAPRARLELVDVAGRRVLDREVGHLGAGEHILRLDGPAPIPAGVYMLRLTQDARVLTTKVTVLR